MLELAYIVDGSANLYNPVAILDGCKPVACQPHILLAEVNYLSLSTVMCFRPFGTLYLINITASGAFGSIPAARFSH